MNRLIICTILLLGSHAALAEKLYRWIEADGSITFSPTPPPAGVDFKAVDAASGGSAKLSPTKAANQKPSILATSEHTLAGPQERVNDTKILTRPTPAVPAQRLTYAPETGSVTPSKATTGLQTNAATPSKQAIASNKKQRQCQDLSKRVLSLERRLRSPLKPQDMDNTVVAMARYQRSYDQYCVN